MSSHTEPMVSIRLSEEDLRHLLHRIDERQRVPVEQRRKHKRYRYHHPGVVLTIEQQGYHSTFLIPLRNISQGGIAFLHRSMLHEGSSCQAHIPLLTRKWLHVRGIVVRCSHVKGMVYEIGLKFDHHIDLDLIIDPETQIGDVKQ